MQWKPVILEVNEDGDIRLAGKIYKTRSQTHGYQSISILVHRLVALAFYGLPPDRNSVVDHIDGNPRNNNVNNLRWLDRSENSRHHPIKKLRKLSDAEIQEIRDATPRNTTILGDLAKSFNVSYAAVRAVRSGRNFNGKGRRSNRTILTPEQVETIRAWKPHSPTAAELARKYKISKTTILNIWRNTF